MTTSQSSADLGRVIGSYPAYEEAQRVVDSLADRMFPVEHVTIIGRDLHLAERVTGRLTIGRAALAGAVSGAWFGLLIGLVFWIVSPWDVGAIISGLLLGALFGACWGAIAQFAAGGRRDFGSWRAVEASRYEVMVDHSYAEDALRVLGSPSTA
jgi:uncharacterized membrane protein